ncbi:sialidase family protein [Maribellus maritimus]|uniref:sialidase family protein n=1 Tax=Maribellus maritimus TaxID=2870838 RepID=UPI001EEBDF65|nr:sialidase family protein [Maribellus maritimus]MCG6186650.1 glycoside hydrolase [Maribellus maritimus]
MQNLIVLLLITLVTASSPQTHTQRILPENWDPYAAGDKVIADLIKVTSSRVKGAHDAEFTCIGNKAYVVAEVNDSIPGEASGWPFIYTSLSVINLEKLEVEKIIPMARGGQIFENDSLPIGACFVPRIIQKDDKTLRCYFTSTPINRYSQIWFIDFDIKSETFKNRIFRAKLKTKRGIFDMQSQYFHEDSTVKPTSGFYIFDSFKEFNGKTYAALNNYGAKQNGLSVLNETLDTFQLLGYYKNSKELSLSESAVNCLPDGKWTAICRRDGTKWSDVNYFMLTSNDGENWSQRELFDFIVDGTNSKPTFDKFKGIYYLGWQAKTEINGKEVSRCLFNVDVSRDGKNWERKYSFKTDKTFQYPTFHEHKGNIWLSVTQGDIEHGKKKIMFGKLE